MLFPFDISILINKGLSISFLFAKIPQTLYNPTLQTCISTSVKSYYAKYFERACSYLGIQHYFSRVRTPKDLACLERFNRTLKEQHLQVDGFTPDITLANQRLTEWLIHNNFERPHQSLGYLTPFQFHQKYHKVLPMSPSRTCI